MYCFVGQVTKRACRIDLMYYKAFTRECKYARVRLSHIDVVNCCYSWDKHIRVV